MCSLFLSVLTGYIFVSCLNITTWSRECVTNSDCSSYNKIRCGVCGRETLIGKDYCMYPFSFVFAVEGNTCSLIRKYCKAGICKNRAECRDGFGVYRCHCTSNKDITYYGMQCEREVKTSNVHYPVGIQVVYEVIVKTFGWNRIYVSTDRYHTGVTFQLTTNEGDLYYFDTPVRKIQMYSYSLNCQANTELENICGILDTAVQVYYWDFAYPVLDVPGRSIFRGNELAGYFTNFTVKAFVMESGGNIFDEHDPVFLKTYPVFVKLTPHRGDCFPRMSIGNCNERIEKAPVYSSADRFNLVANHHEQTNFPSADCVVSDKYRWEFWKVALNNEARFQQPFLQWFEYRHYLWVEPHQLDPGKYKVLVKTSYLYKSSEVGFDSYYNYAQGSFNLLKRLMLNNVYYFLVHTWYYLYMYRCHWSNISFYISKHVIFNIVFLASTTCYEIETFNTTCAAIYIISVPVLGYQSLATTILYNLRGVFVFEYNKFFERNGIVVFMNIYLRHQQCYIEITTFKLVAIIQGGLERFVNTENLNYADGSISYDPNVPWYEAKDGLIYDWLCTFNDTGKDCNLYIDHRSNNAVLYIPRYFLKVGKVYNITLKVSKSGRAPGYTYQLLYVGTNEQEPIVLNCGNCKQGYIANPREYIYIYVRTETGERPKKEFDYTWEYAIVNSRYQSANNIRLSDTNKFVFVVDKNKLADGKTYYFRASVPKSEVSATLRIETPELIKFKCTPQPTEGIAGLTLFNITCLIPDYTGLSYVFEFYDKTPRDEPLFSGRMIGSSMTGELYNFRLTRGVIIAYSYDDNKVTTEVSANVKLAPFSGTVADMVNIVTEISKSIKDENYDSAFSSASVVPDILTPQMKRSDVIKDLVNSLRQIPLESMSGVKMCLSSIVNILTTMSKKVKNFTMTAEVAKQSADVVLEVTSELMKRVIKIEFERTLTDTILHQMARSVLDSVQIILAQKNVEVRTKPEEYVNPVVLDLVRDTSHELVSVLDMIAFTLLRQQLPGDRANEINSTNHIITAWVKVDEPRVMHNVTMKMSTSKFPLRLSQRLADSVERLTDNIGVEFIRLKINPYWWAGGNIVTEVLLVSFCYKVDLTSCHAIPVFKYPMHLYYDVADPIKTIAPINGNISQLDPTMDDLDLDLAITVYRFDPPLRAKLFIEFLFDANREYRVLFIRNLRPDYEMMTKEAVVINRTNPVYNLQYDISDRDKFYYMGILPGKENPVNYTTEFKLKIYYTLCETWVTWQWFHRGCWVGNETNKELLQCDCTHLSLFAGTVGIPENDLNPTVQYPLFLTPQDNPLPFILLLIFLILYLIMCMWGRFKDSRDSGQLNVILLEDNYPGDRYAYLLGVYTGSRINASTDANVGVKLVGEENESRPHILKSSTRSTLNGNSDDWFLLYCPRHLGILTSLEIWHDNTGASPDWFVEKINVFDLKDKLQYVFLIHLWIALEVDEYPDAIITPANLNEYFSVKSMFQTNIVTGIRDTHYWASILWKHPRNPVTRVERINVVMCFIMTAMVVSLLAFLIYYKADVNEADASFSFTDADIVIFILTFIAASLVACIVMTFFRKSYSIKYMRKRSSLFLGPDILGSSFSSSQMNKISVVSLASQPQLSRADSVKSVESYQKERPTYQEITKTNINENFIRYGLRSIPRQERSTYANFVTATHAIVRGSPLIPVKMEKYPDSLVFHRSYCIIACVLCAIIIVVSAIIVSWLGWGLPIVKGDTWATVFLGVVLFDALIFSTVKIFFFSAILSFMFQRLIQSTTYNIKAKDGIQRKLVGDEDHLYKLAEIRSQPMYCPLSDKMKEMYRQKRIRTMKWRILVDFLVVLLLILVLIMLIAIFVTQQFNSNDHAAFMLTHGHRPDFPNFKQIFNRTDFENFAERNFVSQLYRYMWYNLEPLVNLDSKQSLRKDWTDDCIMRLLGNAHIRQLRVELGNCPQVRYFENTTHDCSPPWSPGVEDTDVYNIRWFVGGYKDVARKSTAWRYTEPEYSNTSRFYGPTATLYPSGGYIANLGYTKSSTRNELASLVSDLWLDHLTRAVFVELTLYNVNTGLFSQVELVAEQMPTGEYLTLAQVESVTTDFSYNLWNITFIVFLVFFLVRMCILMNRNGIFVYLSKTLNVFEVFLLVLQFFTVLLYFIHVKTASDYVQEFQRGGINEFFSFYKIIGYAFMSKAMMCLLFACVVIRLLASWRFGRVFFSFYYTFLLSWPWIVWLTLYFILCLVIMWRFIGYILNIFIYSYYANVIVYYKDFSVSGIHDTRLSKLVVYVMCFLSALVILVFIASFAYYYKVAKCYRLIDTDTYNFASFLRDEIKGCCKKKRK